MKKYVLAILFVLLIAGGGYYVYSQKRAPSIPAENAQKINTSATTNTKDVLISEDATSSPRVQRGIYFFDETIGHGPDSTGVSYMLKVAGTPDNLRLYLNIQDSYAKQVNVFAKPRYTGEKIDVVFDSYLPNRKQDESLQKKYDLKQGDVIFTLTPNGKNLAVSWGKIAPTPEEDRPKNGPFEQRSSYTDLRTWVTNGPDIMYGVKYKTPQNTRIRNTDYTKDSPTYFVEKHTISDVPFEDVSNIWTTKNFIEAAREGKCDYLPWAETKVISGVNYKYSLSTLTGTSTISIKKDYQTEAYGYCYEFIEMITGLKPGSPNYPNVSQIPADNDEFLESEFKLLDLIMSTVELSPAWKIYVNEKYNLKFRYPSDYKLLTDNIPRTNNESLSSGSKFEIESMDGKGTKILFKVDPESTNQLNADVEYTLMSYSGQTIYDKMIDVKGGESDGVNIRRAVFPKSGHKFQWELVSDGNPQLLNRFNILTSSIRFSK